LKLLKKHSLLFMNIFIDKISSQFLYFYSIKSL